MKKAKQINLDAYRGVALGMFFFQVLKGCFSLVLVMLSASLFGAGIERDAWVIAWTFQIIVFKLIFGPVNETFRTKFIQLRAEMGQQYALNSAYALLLFFCFLSVLVILVSSVFNPELVSFIAPGYTDPADQLIIGNMIQLMIPILLLSHAVTLFVALINSFQSFYLPELYGLFSLLLNILLLYFFAHQWGIYTFVIANYLSSGLLLLLLLVFLAKKELYPFSFKFRLSAILPYLLFAGPLYLYYLGGQLNGWAERVLVSYLGVGNNSALDYARKFIDFPNTIIFVIGSAVMTPTLSAIWMKEQNGTDFKKNFFVFLRMGMILVVPVMVLFCVCPDETVRLLLFRGHFAAAWIAPTADSLYWFGLGLPGSVLFTICGQVLLVQKRAGLYAALGIGVQLLPIVFNFAFLNRAGLPIFGLSWCIFQYIGGLLLFYLTKAYHMYDIKKFLNLMIVLITALAGAYLSRLVLAPWPDLFSVSMSVFVSLLLLFAGLAVLKTDEYTGIKKRIGGLLNAK